MVQTRCPLFLSSPCISLMMIILIEPVVVALVVAAALSTIWIPFVAIFLLRTQKGVEGPDINTSLFIELFGNFLIWILILIPAAVATVKYPLLLF